MVNKDVCYHNIINLNSYDRLSVMSELLRSSTVIELEFYLNIIEGILKFHKPTLVTERNEVNSGFIIPSESVDSLSVRLKLIVSLALLNESNYIGAERIFQFLKLNYDKFSEMIEHNSSSSEDVILIYQLANEHPAFSFNHCSEIYNYLTKIRSLHETKLPHKRKEKTISGNIHINDVEVSSVSVDANNNYVYKIKVKWNNQELCIHRTLEDVYRFYTKVYQMFQNDICSLTMSFVESPELSKQLISDFFRQFLKSPSYVLRCDYVRSFLEPWSRDIAGPCTDCTECHSYYNMPDEDCCSSSLGGPYPPDSSLNTSSNVSCNYNESSSDGGDDTTTTTNHKFDNTSVSPLVKSPVPIITPDHDSSPCKTLQPLHHTSGSNTTITNLIMNNSNIGTITNVNNSLKKTKKIRQVHSSGSSPIRTPSEDSSGHNSGSDYINCLHKNGLNTGSENSGINHVAFINLANTVPRITGIISPIDDTYCTKRQFSLDSSTKSIANAHKNIAANSAIFDIINNRTENWLSQSSNTITEKDSITPCNQSQLSTPSQSHSYNSLYNGNNFIVPKTFKSSCLSSPSGSIVSQKESDPHDTSNTQSDSCEGNIEQIRGTISSTSSSISDSSSLSMCPTIVSVSEESIMGQYRDCFIYNLHQWLREIRLHKYFSKLRGMRFGELRSITELGDLTKLGITRGAAKKLMSYIHSLTPASVNAGPISKTINDKRELYVSLHVPENTYSTSSSSSDDDSLDMIVNETSAFPNLSSHTSQTHCVASEQKVVPPTINRWKSHNHPKFVQQLRKSIPIVNTPGSITSNPKIKQPQKL